MPKPPGQGPGTVAGLTREAVVAAMAEGPDAVLTLFTTVLTPLVERLAALEAERAKDSHNSSKPPSSDPRHARTPASRSLRQRSGKRPGGQPGHPGTTLRWQAEPQVVVHHVPTHCAECGQALEAGEPTPAAATPLVERRQVTDLPPSAFAVTEHQVGTLQCPRCGAWTRGTFPPEARTTLQYGPGVEALAVYLTTRQLLPVQRAAELLGALGGQAVSPATVLAAEERARTVLAPIRAHIRAGLARAPVVHFDETGFVIRGQQHWLHTASTSTLTHYTAHPRRGRVAHAAIGLLPDYRGTAVHDGSESYGVSTGAYPCRHALCGAHLLRELTFLAEEEHERWARALKRALLAMKRGVARARAAGRDALDRRTLGRYHRRYAALLAEGEAAHPPPAPRRTGRRGGAKPRRSAAGKLLYRLRRDRAAVLRFLHDFAVPFDNSQAERDLRMMKVEQKITGGFRTPAGAGRFCTLRGYLSTAQKQSHGALDVLGTVFAGHPFIPTVPE